MAEICYIECEAHGHIVMSFDSERAIEKAEHHKADCDAQMHMHVFESQVSRKL